MKCNLCNGPISLFFISKTNKYYKCSKCSSVMMHPDHFLTLGDEKARYKKHNNDVEDIRYQNFVSPIVEAVKDEFGTEAKGLDFGSGTGPVITKLLTEAGYKMELYDPFFNNNSSALESKYDFIVCCEVIEHFNNPIESLRLLKSLLKPGGVLYCKTDIYSDDIEFNNWYYKNDPTHVFFYHVDSLYWIKENLNFSKLEIQDRLIKFKV